MLKKAWILSKYILATLFLVLPTPIYICIQEYYPKAKISIWFAVAITLLYLLLTLFVISIVNKIKYWIISAATISVLLCVICLCKPDFYKIIVIPSFPLALGHWMLGFGKLFSNAFLGTIVCYIHKVIFCATVIIVCNCLKNPNYDEKNFNSEKELRIVVYGNVIVVVSCAIVSFATELMSGIDETQIVQILIETLIAPLAYLARFFVAVLFSIYALFDIMGWIGTICFVLIGGLVCAVSVLLWRKLAGKAKAISAIKIIVITLSFCLYTIFVLILNFIL